MKTWKDKTRRGLASLLALVMCLGLLQIPAFAADTDGAESTGGEVQTSSESAADPHASTSVDVGGTTVDVPNTVTTETPTTNEDGSTTTTTTWEGSMGPSAETNNAEVKVEGSETTTETTEKTTVEGSETATVTEQTEGDVELAEGSEITWDDEENGAEGWDDTNAPETDTDPNYDAPLSSSIEIDLAEKEESGSFSGRADAVDWTQVQETLKNDYNLTDADLDGFNALAWEWGNEAENGTSIKVEEGKITIVKTEVDNVTWEANSFTGSETGEPTPVPPTFEKPEGDWTEMKDENGVIIGYQQIVENADGTTTTTMKKTVTETTVSGAGTVMQHRIITTTTIDLSKAYVEVEVQLNEFEEVEDGSQPKVTDYCDVTGGEKTTCAQTPQTNAIAAYGYWGAAEGPGSLKSVAEASQVYDLTEEDAKAATQAALFRDTEGLNDKAKEFYDYLIRMASAAPEGSEESTGEAIAPTVVGGATVTIDDEHSVEVSFIVSLAPSSTGGLEVTIVSENGQEWTEPLSGENENIKLVDNENGTYTVTLIGVKLSNETTAVNLTITTSETVTDREVYKVTTTVPGTDPIETQETVSKIEGGQDKIDVMKGEKTFETSDYAEIYVKQSTYIGIFVPKEDPRSNEEIIAAAQLKDPSLTKGNGDDGGRIIIVIKGDGTAYLHKNEKTVVTVKDGILTVNGDISHVTLVSGGQVIPGTPETTKTTYGMTETTKVIKQSADLMLHLILGNATMTEQVQNQDRTGTAAMTRTDTTTQTETHAEWKWSRGTGQPDQPGPEDPGPSHRPDRPTPKPDPDPVPPPEVEVPDEDVPLEELPPTEPSEELPPELPEPVEIPEEEIPLVEIPDTKVPLAAAPKAKKPAADAPKAKKPAAVTVEDTKVPLADVPKTGDSTSFWAAALALSICGLAVLTWKKDEDETV